MILCFVRACQRFFCWQDSDVRQMVIKNICMFFNYGMQPLNPKIDCPKKLRLPKKCFRYSTELQGQIERPNFRPSAVHIRQEYYPFSCIPSFVQIGLVSYPIAQPSGSSKYVETGTSLYVRPRRLTKLVRKELGTSLCGKRGVARNTNLCGTEYQITWSFGSHQLSPIQLF